MYLDFTDRLGIAVNVLILCIEARPFILAVKVNTKKTLETFFVPVPEGAKNLLCVNCYLRMLHATL